MKIPSDLCAIWKPRTTHNDLLKRDPLKLYATSVILKRATSECNCEEKKTQHTYLAQIHRDTRAHVRTHTHTRPFPLPQLYNLNARDSLTKTSWAACVIAVYLGMRRNSFSYSHGELVTCVIHTWNKELCILVGQKSHTILTIRLLNKVRLHQIHHQNKI